MRQDADLICPRLLYQQLYACMYSRSAPQRDFALAPHRHREDNCPDCSPCLENSPTVRLIAKVELEAALRQSVVYQYLDVYAPIFGTSLGIGVGSCGMRRAIPNGYEDLPQGDAALFEEIVCHNL